MPGTETNKILLLPNSCPDTISALSDWVIAYVMRGGHREICTHNVYIFKDAESSFGHRRKKFDTLSLYGPRWGPKGSSRLNQPPRIFRQSATECGKVVSPTHRSHLPPERSPKLISVRGWSRPQGHNPAGMIKSIKNLKDTSGIEPATSELVTQCTLEKSRPKNMRNVCSWYFNCAALQEWTPCSCRETAQNSAPDESGVQTFRNQRHQTRWYSSDGYGPYMCTSTVLSSRDETQVR